MAAAGVSLLTPLPYFTTPNFRGHLFANAGRSFSLLPGNSVPVVDLSLGASAVGQIKTALSQPSASVGFGVALRHSFVRLEANYCVPLARHPGELRNAGIQVGLGVNFL